MKSYVIAAGAVAGLFLLAGCAGQELHKAQLVTPQGSEFNQGLYRGYIGLSEAEYAEGDYSDSDTFAKRAMAAASGTAVGPEELAQRRLPSANMAELTDARAKLLAALNSGAAKANPRRAAEAQVNFDCWMQEQEENWQPADIAQCRDSFNVALADIGARPVAVAPVVPPSPQAVRFVVYFKTDDFGLDANAAAVIAEAKAAARKLGTPIVKVSGGADTVGSSDYNRKLSELRAQAVAKVLQTGTPVRAMVTEANGELVPAVVTRDNTPEQRNRRVEIILEP